LNTELTELQNWYATQCDGDWEHQDGIEIITLDNPGWRVAISLRDTRLADVVFEPIEENYANEAEWLRCWVDERKFHAAGGALMLSRILRIFLDWASANEAS
jgi:hypothetical protein